MWTENKSLRINAVGLCKDFLGGAWEQITSEEIIIEKLSGGLTNLLYLCRLPEYVRSTKQEPKCAVLRVCTREDLDTNGVATETALFMLLSERKLGPKLYGIFPHGRLEEYIPSRCASWDDMRMPHISVAVAEEFAKVHSLVVPIKKKPTWLINQMKSWLEFFRNNVALGDLNPEDRKIFEYASSFDLEKEISWLDSEIKRTGSPVVFSHNDLQGGNILLPKVIEGQSDVKTIMFIDYEHSNYNYRGFDIGNHFCEWCFSYAESKHPYYATDLTRFPNQEEQELFFNAYVKKMEDIHPDLHHETNVNDLMEEIKVFALSAHMIWSLWSFFMAYTSSITFGYWEYGKTRLESYRKQKIQFFSSLGDIPTLQLGNGDAGS